MILAALLILLYRSSQHGWNRASFEFITITFLSGIAEAWGTSTGLLFGNYSYTSGFGWKIGGILPLAIPLAWYVVLQGAFDGARLATNHICHPRLHLILCWSLAATIATLTDLNLEPVAIHVREYWIWWEDANRTIPKTFPPAGNFITWFLLSLALLPFIHFPSHHTPSHHTPSQLKPFHILILINSLFLCGHLGRFW